MVRSALHVAVKKDTLRRYIDIFYIQVAMSIADRYAEKREYRALASAKDHYTQYLFTPDTLLQKWGEACEHHRFHNRRTRLVVAEEWGWSRSL